jgi:hypothetical protein
MTTGDRPVPQSAESDVEQAELAKFGVMRVPTDVFLWGDYRYSNARDALAAAKRAAKQ